MIMEKTTIFMRKENNKTKFFKNLIVKNTIILIVSSILIKGLSLFNRVILTRLLGNEGISLYVLSLPTIMLLLSLGGFSLNITINKIVSENEVSKQYTRRQIINQASIIGLLFSFIMIIIFVIFAKVISYNLLKQPNTYFPILSSILIVPFVALNNIYRGFYNGLNKVNITANSNIIEQITRLFLSTTLLFLFKAKPITFTVTITIIAMAIGEMIQAMYNISKLHKFIKDNDEKTPKLKRKALNEEIISISLSQTTSHLIANISFFLEPIIYTYALSKVLIDSNQIIYKYSEVTAYALPLLTMFFFISHSIATVIMPTIIKYKENNNKQLSKEKTNNIVSKSLIASLLPGILFAILFSYYSKDYMLLLYNTTIGANIVAKYAFIFVIFYTQPILIAILNSYGKQKQLLLISIFDSITKLVLLYSLTLIKTITYNSLIISYLITNVIATLILYLYVKKLLSLKIKAKNLVKIIYLIFITFITTTLLKCFNINYLISSIIVFILYILYIFLLRLHRFNDK